MVRTMTNYKCQDPETGTYYGPTIVLESPYHGVLIITAVFLVISVVAHTVNRWLQ